MPTKHFKGRRSGCFKSYIFVSKSSALDTIRWMRRNHPHLREFVIDDEVININELPFVRSLLPGHVCESHLVEHPFVHCLILRSRRSSTLAASYVYVYE